MQPSSNKYCKHYIIQHSAVMVAHQPPRGSKLPRRYENPLDWLLIRALMPTMPVLHRLNITPNMVTAASALCAAASLYCMVKGKVGFALALWGMNYLFDLADGLKARLYDQQSYLGSCADHCSDILSVLGLYAVILWKVGGAWSLQRAWPLVVEALLMVVGLKHFECQERYSQARTDAYIPVEGIDVSRCEDVNAMRWTRWFGIATITLWHLFLIYEFT